MKIAGLRKTTLLDYPGKVACTIFLSGCNLRCPFCHNAPLVIPSDKSDKGEDIGAQALFSFLEKRIGIIEGVCITGGEPTLRHDLPDLISRIKSLGYAVKLDTNGTNPKMLQGLIDGRLVDYVAMDIKNSPAKYAETVGVPGFDLAPINESISIIMNAAGSFDYEFRTTAVSGLHTEKDFSEIGRWICGAKRYFIQNFVDSGSLICPGMKGVSPEEMKEFLNAVKEFIPSARLRGI